MLLPTFIILDSVDFRLDNGGMGAYSCADGMGGGKNGDPGDGKGDEEDNLLTATVSKGVSGSREEKGEGERSLVEMDESTTLGHRPFVSGVMTAEVIPGIFKPKEGWAVTFWTKRSGAETMTLSCWRSLAVVRGLLPDNHRPFRQKLSDIPPIMCNNYSRYCTGSFL